MKLVPATLVSLICVGWAPTVGAQEAESSSVAAESTVGERQLWRQVMVGPGAVRPTFGVGAVNDAFVTISAAGFNNVGVFGNSIFGLNAARACLATQCTVVADLPVPHGATIVGSEIDGCDLNPSGGQLRLRVLRVPGNNENMLPLILSEFDAASGCQYTSNSLTPHHQVDQYLDNYYVEMYFEGTDSWEFFQAVRVYYRSGGGEVIPTGTEPSLFQ